MLVFKLNLPISVYVLQVVGSSGMSNGVSPFRKRIAGRVGIINARARCCCSDAGQVNAGKNSGKHKVSSLSRIVFLCTVKIFRGAERFPDRVLVFSL